MTDRTETSGIDRRALMLRAVWLVGGTATAASLASCGRSSSGPFFNTARRALLDAVSDTMIPVTDTPGALAAEVPAFIDSMMTDWASRERQGRFVAALDAIDDRARNAHRARFADLTPEQQLSVLTQHDIEALAEPENPYRQLKELILLGYYSSEIGATQELRYELVPGRWDADIPFADGDRAWAF